MQSMHGSVLQGSRICNKQSGFFYLSRICLPQIAHKKTWSTSGFVTFYLANVPFVKNLRYW